MTKEKPDRVLVVDDHEVVRSGLALMLARWKPDVELLLAETKHKAEEFVRENADIDLILLDLMLPGVNGFELVDLFVRELPAVPLAILSMEEGSSMIYSAISRGARAYVLKSNSEEEMLRALDTVMAGDIYMPPSARNIVLPPGASLPVFNRPDMQIAPKLDGLTGRQIEILSLLVQGKSNKEISTLLSLSPATVRSYLTIIFRQLDVRNRTEAANVARKLGLISQ